MLSSNWLWEAFISISLFSCLSSRLKVLLIFIWKFSGVSNCYVFKSRLQEYAQKVGLPTPVYETVKEGPFHQPCLRSTVIVDEVRYDSLLGFFNRKAAEQSAAEVALMELANTGKLTESVSQPVVNLFFCHLAGLSVTCSLPTSLVSKGHVGFNFLFPLSYSITLFCFMQNLVWYIHMT